MLGAVAGFDQLGDDALAALAAFGIDPAALVVEAAAQAGHASEGAPQWTNTWLAPAGKCKEKNAKLPA